MSQGTWSLQFGAQGKRQMEFTVWAPNVEHITVVSEDEKRCLHLEKGESGIHHGRSGDFSTGSSYFYKLPDGLRVPDPVSRFLPQGVHGPTAIIDPHFFSWTDHSWQGLNQRDLVIYELHVGTFSKRGTFEALTEKLDYFLELGINAIELMPIAQFPGKRNWGYDGVSPYAVQNSYGEPDSLKAFIDAAHSARIAVILDVVYNHLGPEGNYLPRFAPYFTDKYATPWGKALNFDGPHSDYVRNYFISNALYWLSEYHFDGLRLDAVHAICDFSAYPFLEELKDSVATLSKATGRQYHLIAESDDNNPRLLESKEKGGYGLEAQWSDDFHHAVHAFLTEERGGYYVDYGKLEHITRALNNNFVYDGLYSEYRKRKHGRKASHLRPEQFVVAIQNHDQVGNRALGERLSTLVQPEDLKLATYLLLLSPFVPLIFMGEEYGEENPFLYFVDHGDEELIEAVRKGRKREFASFDWGERELPDAAAETTFERCTLEIPPESELRDLYKELIRLRKSLDLSAPRKAHAQGELLTLQYEERFLILLNFSSEDVSFSLPEGSWKQLLGEASGQNLPGKGASVLRNTERTEV